jgi:hypothetical protein
MARLTVGFALATLVACATIPRAAPELSGQLTARIQETRIAHVELVRLYMDEKRAVVDRFIMTEWLPLYSETFFAIPEVLKEWERIARTNDTAERVRFIAGVGQRLQTQINQKRLELMAPLDETERAIARRLEDHYNEMLSVNTVLTGLLEAGAKSTETQQNIRRRLGAEEKLPTYVDEANRIVNILVQSADSYEKNRAKIDSLIDVIKRRT